MAEFRDLSTPQKRLVRYMFTNVMDAISHDTPRGHLPKCGYESDPKGCHCFETGIRARQAMIDTVAAYTPFPKEGNRRLKITNHPKTSKE